MTDSAPNTDTEERCPDSWSTDDVAVRCIRANLRGDTQQLHEARAALSWLYDRYSDTCDRLEHEHEIAELKAELSTLRECDHHLAEAARLLRICASESPENAHEWPSLGAWLAADAHRAKEGA